MPTLTEIAVMLGRPVEGNGEIVFARAAEPSMAGAGDLALAMSPEYSEALMDGGARVALLWEGADYREFGLEGAVTVPRARVAMAGITRTLDPGPDWGRGIHPSAVIHPDATVPEDAIIGPMTVIGPGVVIGPRARIGPQVTIEADATIGADALIHPRVVIGARVEVGDRFICQAGAVIGGDGFSFVTAEESGVERARKSLGDRGDVTKEHWGRIHSLGAVTIEDDVEVGSNSTIDRGTVVNTRIGRGTKLDSLVHLGHNVQMGEDCLVCGQAGVAGSAVIGNRVVLGGRVAVNDHITVGDDVVAGGGSGLFTRVAAGKVILGTPAIEMDKQIALQKAVRRLPRLAEQVAELRKTVTDLLQRDGHDNERNENDT